MGGSFFLLPHLNSSWFIFLSIFTVVMILLSHPSLLFQLKHSSTVLHSFLSFWQCSSLSSVSSPFLYTAKSFHYHLQGPIQLSLQIYSVLIFLPTSAITSIHLTLSSIPTCPLCTSVTFLCVAQINPHPCASDSFASFCYPLLKLIIIKCT